MLLRQRPAPRASGEAIAMLHKFDLLDDQAKRAVAANPPRESLEKDAAADRFRTEAKPPAGVSWRDLLVERAGPNGATRLSQYDRVRALNAWRQGIAEDGIAVMGLGRSIPSSEVIWTGFNTACAAYLIQPLSAVNNRPNA